MPGNMQQAALECECCSRCWFRWNDYVTFGWGPITDIDACPEGFCCQEPPTEGDYEGEIREGTCVPCESASESASDSASDSASASESASESVSYNCSFYWDGVFILEWIPNGEQSCPPGFTCVEPSTPGTYQFEVRDGTCE